MDHVYFWLGTAGALIGTIGLALALVRAVTGGWSRSKAIENAFFSAGLLSVGTYLVTGMNVFLVPFLGFTLAGAVYQARKRRELQEQTE